MDARDALVLHGGGEVGPRRTPHDEVVVFFERESLAFVRPSLDREVDPHGLPSSVGLACESAPDMNIACHDGRQPTPQIQWPSQRPRRYSTNSDPRNGTPKSENCAPGGTGP